MPGLGRRMRESGPTMEDMTGLKEAEGSQKNGSLLEGNEL